MKNQTELIHSTGWRELVILDACRYDYFVEEWLYGGVIEKVKSAGSCTIEWAKRTWTGIYEDVIYLATIPYIGKLDLGGWRGIDHFGLVHPMWRGAWHEGEGTVLPEVMCEVFRVFRKRSPDSRLVIHFLQPHHPYIGTKRVAWEGGTRKSRESVMAGGNGIVDVSRVAPPNFLEHRLAYRDNLRRVLEAVKVILRPGMAVTADHGELLGGGEGWLHPPGSDNPILREVPWVYMERDGG